MGGKSSTWPVPSVKEDPFATVNNGLEYLMAEISPEKSKLQLILGAKELSFPPFSYKCNPMAVVFEKTTEGEVKEIGRTEIQLKCCEPVWTTPVPIYYEPDAKLGELEFHIYRVDREYVDLPGNTLKLDEQKVVGKVEPQYLRNIIPKLDRTLEFPLLGVSPEQTRATLTVHVERIIAPTQAFEMEFRGSKLPNMDRFSKSDPFLRISRCKNDERIAIHQTEVVKDNLNPKWKSVCLKFHSKDILLVIECFDYNRNGKLKRIGETSRSLEELEMCYKNGWEIRFEGLEGQIFVEKFIRSVL